MKGEMALSLSPLNTLYFSEISYDIFFMSMISRRDVYIFSEDKCKYMNV